MQSSLDKIESLAPDQGSLSAAVKIKASAWQVLAHDERQEFAWGECQGSGSAPYRVCIQLSDLGYKCTCPSRKFPCKHSLSLMLLLAKSPQSFGKAGTPDWVTDWVTRRRQSGGEKKQETPKPKTSLGEALQAEPAKERDEKAEVRAAQQRERLKTQREEAILSGLDELDRWIEDSLARGLASFMGEAAQRCRMLGQRLVDAKAPSLATAIDALPSTIMALPEPMRNDALVEALGELHLLAEAYRRQDKLPDTLRHDVRRLVGWTVERQALLEDGAALRVQAVWTVIATHTEIQPDKLRRTETWLMGVNGGHATPAVLIDFVPVAASTPGSTFLAGEVFAGELVFYPSASPLRAIISARDTAPASLQNLPALPLASALAAYDELRAMQPWLKQWPITIGNPSCKHFDKSGVWILDGIEGLPVAPKHFQDAVILTSVQIHSLTGLWDGRFFTPSMAETAIGRWVR